MYYMNSIGFKCHCTANLAHTVTDGFVLRIKFHELVPDRRPKTCSQSPVVVRRY